MNFRCYFSIVISFLFFCLNSQLLSQSLQGYEEEDLFYLFKNESKIGTIEYSLRHNGAYKRTFTLMLAGQKIDYHLTLTPDEQGVWKNSTIITPTDTVTVTRTDSTAVYKTKSNSVKVKLHENYILYDSYGPVFETVMLRQYDMEQNGEQTIKRFLFPSQFVDVTLQYTEEKIASVNGEKRKFLRFDLNLMGIIVEIWADEDFKIYMMNVPVQYATYIRSGFKDLMQYRQEDKSVSQAKYGIEKKTVMIPMRDKIHLATDLYFPKTDSVQKFPVILIRTPYKKEMQQLDGEYYSKRGYVLAVQDCRGRFASEGEWVPFMHEAEDGYDTIEWLGTRDWCNGKVGMIGASYVGWVQLWAASQKPPHLTTIIPNVAPPDPFYNIPYEYGTFYILGSMWWAQILETEATEDLSGRILNEINQTKYEQILKSLPVIDLDEKILGHKNPYWRAWIKNNVNNDYWQPANFIEKLKDLDLPVFLQSGWFDGDGIGSKLNYMALKKSKNRSIKLVLGPWGHTNQSSTRFGNVEFGSNAAMDLQTRYLKWFDYWLKGKENEILEEPLVKLYVMFSNKWLQADVYPLPNTKFKKLYLTSKKGANTSLGDGKLVTSIITSDKNYDSYIYDPGDPTPDPNYYYKTEEEIKKEKEGILDPVKRKKRIKAFHNNITDSRNDILVYETAPLDSSISVAGPLSAKLYASTSGVDTDWFMSIMDVDEEGDIFYLARGTVRARFRESTKKCTFPEKNRVYEYDIDLWQTGITFRKGHRIRIEISSALFPTFSRNLNTGGHNEMETNFIQAEQKIYHSSEYPSYILLPIVDID